jgi:hypothetical protein
MKGDYIELIKKDSIDYFMITRPTLTMGPEELRSTIISYLSQNNDMWKLVYWDDISLLFVKNNEHFRNVIDSYEFKYLTPYNIIFNVNILNNALNQSPEAVKSEFNRKRTEGTGAIFMNQFLKVFSQRLK